MWTDSNYGYGRPSLRKPGGYGDEEQPSFLGDGSEASPISVGGDPSLYVGGPVQKRNKFQSFLGGMGGGRGLMGGLASLSGQGGAAGGIGSFAKFLL